MHAKLVVVGGDAKAAVIRLKLPTIVGRGRNASLTLPHPLVSREHCEIVESNGRLLVRDLGSLNGTFIGKERITEAILPPGELLTIGTVTFRAVYDEPAAEVEQEPGNNGQAGPGRGESSAGPSALSVVADQERAPDGDDGTERGTDKSAEDTGEQDEMELLPADPDAELPVKPVGKQLRQLAPAAPRSPAPDSADDGSADDGSADDGSADDGSADDSSADDSDDDAELLHDDSLEELHLGEVPDEEGVSTIADAADRDDEPSDLGDAAGKEQQLPQGPSTKPSLDGPSAERGTSGQPEGIGPPAEPEIPGDGLVDGDPAEEEQADVDPADVDPADVEPAEEEPAEDLDDDLRSFLRGFQ